MSQPRLVVLTLIQYNLGIVTQESRSTLCSLLSPTPTPGCRLLFVHAVVFLTRPCQPAISVW